MEFGPVRAWPCRAIAGQSSDCSSTLHLHCTNLASNLARDAPSWKCVPFSRHKGVCPCTAPPSLCQPTHRSSAFKSSSVSSATVESLMAKLVEQSLVSMPRRNCDSHSHSCELTSLTCHLLLYLSTMGVRPCQHRASRCCSTQLAFHLVGLSDLTSWICWIPRLAKALNAACKKQPVAS